MKEEGEGEIDVGLTLFPSGCPKKSLEWNRNYESRVSMCVRHSCLHNQSEA